jgi:exonuclease III
MILKDESSEILPWGYTIYRKDRKSRAGGVLLAVKSCSFSTFREINFDTDLELVTVELTSKSNSKYLLCCCYKSQQNVNSQWLGKFNLFLTKSCSQYSNMLVCGDFNFPKISWKSLQPTTGVDEVQFTEQLYDYHLTQLNTFPTRGNNNVLDLVIPMFLVK